MSDKNVEQYATRIEEYNRLFEERVTEAANEATKIMSDWRYSESYRLKKKQEVIKYLSAEAENISKIFRETVNRFCDDFKIVLPEDGKDHKQEIENALKVIDMLGYSLTESILSEIIRPLRGSFRNMRLILNILEAKNHDMAIAAGEGYSHDVIKRIHEFGGISSSVGEYLDLFECVGDIVEANGADYGFDEIDVSNAKVVEIIPRIPYSFLSCAGWMRQLAQMYGRLEKEFSDLFSDHIPTAREEINKILSKH